MVAICIVDFVLGYGRFQGETNQKLAALEKEVAELKGPRDLNAKI